MTLNLVFVSALALVCVAKAQTVNRDPCLNFGCLNGGYCTAPADAPYCVCQDGFTGDKCESQIEGQCPELEQNGAQICGGTICDNDTQCEPLGQKCCPNLCGGNLCTNVTTQVTTPDQPVCPQGCPEGYTCEFKPFPCKMDMDCPAIEEPTCVPPCGGCPDGEVCQSKDVICIRAPCKKVFECVPVTTPKPLVACNLFCIRGFECKLVVPSCSFWNRRYCSTRPVATCVPKCPTINGPRRRCPRWRKPRNTCSSDNDCRNRNQRCCPTQCDWDVCTSVKN